MAACIHAYLHAEFHDCVLHFLYINHMYLSVIGINHRTAPVEIRGQVVFPPEQQARALEELVALEGVEEAAILSTCNRTELYCSCSDTADDTLPDWLCRFHGLQREALQPHLYTHLDGEAVRHMLRVASGLDSLVLGEPQILGQMKACYQQASDAGTLDSLVNRLFQHTFQVAKQVRTDTAIGASPVSVAFAAVSLARQIFGEFRNHTALLIGAGETIELTARHLHEHGIGQIIIANRTVERAVDLAAQFNGYGIALDQLDAHLAEADIVIASTGSPDILLNEVSARNALRGRKHRPMFMVDIAVPGDIDPAVAKLNDVYFYTVDDLQDVIEENLKSRQEAAEQAEDIIDVQVEHFMSWVRSLDAVPAIRAYREHARTLGELELKKARQRLANGDSADAVMESLTRNLINKLAHAPSVNLREAADHGKTGLLETVRTLFSLKSDK
jgi:glutamyl-tRNA reductase